MGGLEFWYGKVRFLSGPFFFYIFPLVFIEDTPPLSCEGSVKVSGESLGQGLGDGIVMGTQKKKLSEIRVSFVNLPIISLARREF